MCYVGTLRSEEEKDLDERWLFFRSAALERGMEPVNIFLPETGRASVFSLGVKAAVQMLSKRDLTAAVCRNDEIAVGLVSGLLRKRIRVPEDVSVIGYDDLPYAKYMNPPLTTIRQDFENLTRAATKLLVDAVVAGKKATASLPERIAVPAVFVARKSTAPVLP